MQNTNLRLTTLVFVTPLSPSMGANLGCSVKTYPFNCTHRSTRGRLTVGLVLGLLAGCAIFVSLKFGYKLCNKPLSAAPRGADFRTTGEQPAQFEEIRTQLPEQAWS